MLLRGEFETGWREHEWRWKSDQTSSFKEKRAFRQPLWLGQESIAGKSILLYMEQGLGDTLQFCRYVKMVADLGARVILEVHKALATLVSDLEGVSQLITRGTPLPAFDYHCPLLSLPLAFKTTLATIPSSSRYLISDAAKVALWRTRLVGNSAPLIGLVWSGNPIHGNDRNRSIPLADLIRHLPDKFQYVSLQKDVRDMDRTTLETNSNVWKFTDDLDDFTDTAALCECLDLIVSVDTSVAHLCGALGKRTWILLPFSPDWRWLLDREDSPWYSHVKLYRQKSIGAWSEVLNRVAMDLRREFGIA